MHAPYLEIGRDNFKVVVDTAQVWLLQLHPYMLCDQINGYHVFLPEFANKTDLHESLLRVEQWTWMLKRDSGWLIAHLAQGMMTSACFLLGATY